MYGGAIFANSSSIDANRGSVFESNSAGTGGGAVALASGSFITFYIADILFLNNSAGEAGG
jgi:predicted outer membrane repeat protein